MTRVKILVIVLLLSLLFGCSVDNSDWIDLVEERVIIHISSELEVDRDDIVIEEYSKDGNNMIFLININDKKYNVEVTCQNELKLSLYKSNK